MALRNQIYQFAIELFNPFKEDFKNNFDLKNNSYFHDKNSHQYGRQRCVLKKNINIISINIANNRNN